MAVGEALYQYHIHSNHYAQGCGELQQEDLQNLLFPGEVSCTYIVTQTGIYKISLTYT